MPVSLEEVSPLFFICHLLADVIPLFIIFLVLAVVVIVVIMRLQVRVKVGGARVPFQPLITAFGRIVCFSPAAGGCLCLGGFLGPTASRIGSRNFFMAFGTCDASTHVLAGDASY